MHTHFTQPHRFQSAYSDCREDKPIRADQVDAWGAEAENGNDIEFLHAPGRKTRDTQHSIKPEGSIPARSPSCAF